MPIQEEDHTLIEKYLLAQLSAEEQAIFERRSNDADFVQELSLQRDLLAAFQAEGREHLKAELQNLEARVSQKESTPQIKGKQFAMRRFLAIAATLLVLVFALSWLLDRGSEQPGSFADYFEAYPNVVMPVNKGSGDTGEQGRAFRAYEAGDYATALQLFDQVPEAGDTISFYSGVCELALDRPKAALRRLETVQQENSSFYAPARWYEALALIQEDKIVQAVTLLDIVIQKAQTQQLKNVAIDLRQKIQ